MKEEGNRRYRIFVSMFVIIGMVFVGLLPTSAFAADQLPYCDIEQDSFGNYHKAYIDNPTGNYEIYYMNDIGGQLQQDWNPPTRITFSDTESILLDFGIYLTTDTMFIIWAESDQFIKDKYLTSPTHYSISRDYGMTWTEPDRAKEEIVLKYANFDPLIGEPDVPRLPEDWASPYAYYVVQMKTPMIEEWWDGVEAVGGVFCGYIPNNAYVIYLNDQARDEIEQLPYIRNIGYYHPVYKIQSGLPSEGNIELNVMVIEETGGPANLDKVIHEITALGGIITFVDKDSFVIRTRIDASNIYDIASIHEVEWIDEYTLPSELMAIIRGFTGAGALPPPYDGSGIVGEVKDNGFDQSHYEFAGRIVGVDGGPPVEEHGTATYGIVFSEGINPDARGMLPAGQGVMCYWNVPRIQSIENLVNIWGGVFQSNSWYQGVQDSSYSSYSQQNDQAVFENDVTMLYAAGNSNDGVGPATLTQDSVAKNVICVGGVFHYNTPNLNAHDWHVGPDVGYGPGVGTTPSQGPAQDWRIKPDLCGPFDEIYTTDILGFPGYSTGDYFPGFSGTSGATPVAAGAAGLVYQMYRANHFDNNPLGLDPHASTVKALLIANAHQYEFAQANRYQQGWGMVDVGKIHRIGDKHFIINEDAPVSTTIPHAYEVVVEDSSEPLKISLVWTDYPVMSSAGQHLANDLNLRVTDPDGNVYWGNWGLTMSKWSIPDPGTACRDDLNNVENVFIEFPRPGLWQIEVIGRTISYDSWTNTPWNDQPYALVVSCEPGYNIEISSFLGDVNSDDGFSIATDSLGNFYVTGITNSPNFPTLGAVDPVFAGQNEGFVSKISADGSTLLWSTFLGGSGYEQCRGIVVDSTGVYVAGITDSNDFPGAGPSNGYCDAFVTKLTLDGTALIYSTLIGGSQPEGAYAIDIDPLGNAYITGMSHSDNYPLVNPVDWIRVGGEVIVTKLNAAGTGILYSTFLGGDAYYDYGTSIAVDPLGYAYVTGVTRSSNFQLHNPFDSTYSNGEGFVTKLSQSGNALVYSTFLGGTEYDCSLDIAVDSAGCAYVTGQTYSDDFPIKTGSYDVFFNGERDVFVTKFSNSGTSLEYSTYIGGRDDDDGLSIALDALNRAYVTGLTDSDDYPTTPDAYDDTFNSEGNILISRISQDGASLEYSTYLIGSNYEPESASLTVDPAGSIYLTGITNTPNFPTTPGAYDETYNGELDAFVTKFVDR